MLIAETFVKDQIKADQWSIKADQWSRVPTLLKTAYAAADDLVGGNPILQVKSAEDNKGRLISWAVDFALERAVETGNLHCDYWWRSFAEPTGRYLELRFEHSRVTVSQVADPRRQPRNVCSAKTHD